MDVSILLCSVLSFLFLCYIDFAFSSFEDVSSSVGLWKSNGILAAFGDFNADKNADLFFISNGQVESKVVVCLWDSSNDRFEPNREATIILSGVSITNVIPGDFNGDGHLDALVSYINESSTYVKLYKGKQIGFYDPVYIPDALRDQPAIVDFDGDLRPDLLANKVIDGKRYWWQYNAKKNSFISRRFPSKENKTLLQLSIPQSSAFLDLNGDYTPDMLITTNNSTTGQIQYEVWLNKEGTMKFDGQKSYSQPDDVSVVGQSTFADIDSDGRTEHILPVCVSNDCSKVKSRVYSRFTKKWITILPSDENQNYKWKFSIKRTMEHVPLMTLRIGDYNIDGYPDAAMVMEINEDNDNGYKRKVILLDNVKCKGNGCYNGRFNMVIRRSALSTIKNPIFVTFFDLYDNGMLDVFVVSSNDTGSYQTHGIKNSVYSDTCFLKVMVVGGSCYSNCPSGVKPYGVNQAGPFVKYVTTGLHGDTKQASATQLSQAAYFALQLPYTIFGLGRTPNFVEELTVGLPQSSSKRRVRTWPSIIPNSQVIIIPHPPNDPNGWISLLLITPSKLVLMTGGALLATCVFIGALIGILHWQEKKEDRREKQEAAHKFHFDAM
ncbi:T-cell immunomodulatory protein-like [Xenia sp. Carnegie-2017]|uniref:T-cell immunomodulatory protein-like n=1 Tax=Xenia sp. Carnegie-2017 TaxID=2897299 RepID=UPI001F033B3E|nr:T-cell immunomodulatory protein-like [Xenia sp. Carnegie-2017]